LFQIEVVGFEKIYLMTLSGVAKVRTRSSWIF